MNKLKTFIICWVVLGVGLLTIDWLDKKLQPKIIEVQVPVEKIVEVEKPIYKGEKIITEKEYVETPIEDFEILILPLESCKDVWDDYDPTRHTIFQLRLPNTPTWYFCNSSEKGIQYIIREDPEKNIEYYYPSGVFSCDTVVTRGCMTGDSLTTRRH